MFIPVGRILKPRGLKGEVKAEITYNRPAVFANVTQVNLNGRPYIVKWSSVQNGFAYLMFIGIDSVEKAERLRGHEISVDTAVLNLADDEMLSYEFIGYKVVQNGCQIGRVRSVENYGGGDFFEIALDGAGVIAIPNEDEFIWETNVATRTLVLSPHALESEFV